MEAVELNFNKTLKDSNEFLQTPKLCSFVHLEKFVANKTSKDLNEYQTLEF